MIWTFKKALHAQKSLKRVHTPLTHQLECKISFYSLTHFHVATSFELLSLPCNNQFILYISRVVAKTIHFLFSGDIKFNMDLIFWN